jgi:hypothetical protein
MDVTPPAFQIKEDNFFTLLLLSLAIFQILPRESSLGLNFCDRQEISHSENIFSIHKLIRFQVYILLLSSVCFSHALRKLQPHRAREWVRISLLESHANIVFYACTYGATYLADCSQFS